MIWTFDYPLRTERLELRPHTLADLDDLEVFHSDPDVTRYIPWPVRDREQVRAALVAKIPQISASAAVSASRLRSTSPITVPERRSSTASTIHSPAAEIGYAFATQGQGKGLATEAVVSLMSAAQRQLGIIIFDALVEEPNLASARLLARVGFTPAPPTEPGLLSFRRTAPALPAV